jgi:phosphohistidine phosphatase
MGGLAPGDEPEKAREEIDATREPLMLVGHLPHLSRLASALLVGDSQREIIRFEPAAIACLARVERGYHVEWILTPFLTGAPT